MILLILTTIFLSITNSKAAADDSATYCGATGWSIWKGNCYKLFSMAESMTFPEAENICRAHSAHAASVHSDAENDYMASIAKQTYELLESLVPVVSGQPLHWDRIHGAIWIGYRRQKDPNSDYFNCRWVDGTPMDYANAPLPDSVRQQTKSSAHWMGYPWEGPNPKELDVSIAVCGGNTNCAGDADHCVEMLNWPGSRIGTWNDLSCTHHKLSGVFCKKPVQCGN